MGLLKTNSVEKYIINVLFWVKGQEIDGLCKV